MNLFSVPVSLIALLTVVCAQAADLPYNLSLDGTANYKANINVVIQGKDENGVEQFAADIGYALELQLKGIGGDGNCRSMRVTLNNVVVNGKMTSDKRQEGNVDTSYVMPSLKGTEIDFCLDARGRCSSYSFVDSVLQNKFDNPAMLGPDAKALAAIVGGLDQYLFFPYPEQNVAPGGSWQMHVNEPVDAGLVNIIVDYDMDYQYDDNGVAYTATNVDLKLGEGFMAMMFKDAPPQNVKLEMSGKYKLDQDSGLVEALDADELIAFVLKRTKDDGTLQVFDLSVGRTVAIARR